MRFVPSFPVLLAVAITAAAFCAEASARPPRVTVRSSSGSTCANGVCTTSTSESVRAVGVIPASVSTSTSTVTAIGAAEALDEVNAARAARGLPPYVRDPGLTQAAMTIAQQRAAQHIAGHTANDFAGLPAGSTAAVAGCAAWHPSMGWGSCATYDRYTFAGAAWAMGSDGKRYMQLFAR